MTRSPAPGDTGREATTVVYLFEVVFHDGSSEQVVRLTSASQPVTTDADGDGSAETYEAAGKLLEWGGERETSDERGQGTPIRMSGVEQSIVSTLLQNDFRGRRVRVWRATGDPSAGTWSTTLVHRGLQLDDYEVREEHPEDANDPVTSRVETRSTSRLAALEATNAVETNRRSHEAMLSRAGVSGDDTGLFYTRQLPGRVFWGSEQPDEATSGRNAGASAGTRGGSGGGGSGHTPGEGGQF